MYKYLVIVHVGLPLLGIAMMERGAFGHSVGEYGYPNGATLAYLLYTAILTLTALLVVGSRGPRPEATWLVVDVSAYRRFVTLLLGIELVVLLVLLFAFDGIRVWLGEMGKGEFRVSLGYFGAVAFFATKTLLPALLAYATSMYVTVSRRGWNRVLWHAAFWLAFLVGTCWGYKTTSILVVLPALLVMYWRISPLRFVAVTGFALVVIVAFYYYFDAAGSMDVIANRLWQRLTVMQGDVPWAIWDQYQRGVEFPSYSRTLWVVIGDKLFSLFTGIQRSDAVVWVTYHYDQLLTAQVGLPLSQILAGHSVTGTPFAEAVIAAGLPGLVLFGVLAGLLVGVLYVALDDAIRKGARARTAILSAYFIFYALSWLSGGAILQLVHISVAVGMLGTYFIILGLRAVRFDRIPPRGAVASAVAGLRPASGGSDSA